MLSRHSKASFKVSHIYSGIQVNHLFITILQFHNTITISQQSQRHQFLTDLFLYSMSPYSPQFFSLCCCFLLFLSSILLAFSGTILVCSSLTLLRQKQQSEFFRMQLGPGFRISLWSFSWSLTLSRSVSMIAISDRPNLRETQVYMRFAVQYNILDNAYNNEFIKSKTKYCGACPF